MGDMITTPNPSTVTLTTQDTDARQIGKVRRAIAKYSFATLATTSRRGRPHVAGVIYDAVAGELWVHTMRASRKARNIAATRYVAVCIPFRKLPAGPPYTLQFQATATLVDMDHPSVVELHGQGKLAHVAAHDALHEPDGVFVRITPHGTVHSYGLGVNPLALLRDPLHAGSRTIDLGDHG